MKRSKSFLCLVVIIHVTQVDSLRRKKQAEDNSNWNTLNVPKATAARSDGDTTEYTTLVINKPVTTHTIQTSDLFNSTPPDKMSVNKEDDPCAVYNPVKPNFQKNSRRISEIKCYDYIWQMKIRNDQNERVKQCQKKHSILANSFVVGGYSTNLGDYPHMAAIGWQGVDDQWVFKCGGTLISENYVLTAAHCTSARSDTRIADTEPKVVRLGEKNILGAYKLNVSIKRIIKHPRYAPPKKYFDIALFELETPVKFSKSVQPACLWIKNDLSSMGPTANVTGWGVKQERGNEGSSELQAATVDLIDSNSCDSYLGAFHNRNWNGLANNQMCAGKLAGGVDVCQGDSGGPLQVQINLPIKKEGFMHYVIGVTSFGIGCARADTPGIYTRVSSFIDWIEQHAWPNNS